MRIVIAGSSGLVGSALVPELREAGHEVVRLVRRPPRAADERSWDSAYSTARSLSSGSSFTARA